MIGRMRTGLYSATYTSDTSYLAYPSGYAPGLGTRRVIVGCHGHGGYSYQYAPASAAMPGFHTPRLVDTDGYAILGVDHATINAWGDPNAMRALDDVYSYLVNTFKMPGVKIGLHAWSMGGLTALNWAIRNPTKVAGVWAWAPATDLRFWENAAGTYTPTYALAGVAQGSYTAEIDAAFGPSTTASAGTTIPALGGAGVTVTVANAKAFADGLGLSGVLAQATVAATNFTYTSKTDTSLVGCVSTTASAITVANAAAITATYAQQSPGYNPWANAANLTVANGFTFPIKIAQASDDTTVPPAMNNDATNGFVARTANPNITQRTPTLTGGHGGLISNVPPAEVAAFYNGLAW